MKKAIKKHFLFHLRTFNDTDHITPVMWKFLERGEKVTAIYLSDFDYKNDYRIKFLKKYPDFRVLKASKLLHMRGKILFNHYIRKLYKSFFICRKIVDILAKHIWPNPLLKKDIAVSVYEWGGPGRLNRFESELLDIPTIAIPHGFNIFLNYDITYKIRDEKDKSGKWPDFSNRSLFDTYVLQTERHKKWSIDWGQDPNKTEAWGSTRFDPEWSKINLELCGTFKALKDDKDKIKVVFFLPHWSYNVNAEKVICLLKNIAERRDIYLVIKGHTRGTGSLSDDWAEKLGQKPNVETNVPDHSPALIKWADVVINFGSSIAIEALNQGKPIINTPYLHTNKTIFDDGRVAHVANSDQEVSEFLDRAKTGELDLPDSECKKDFFFHEVYGSRKPMDVPGYYCDRIFRLERRFSVNK